MTDLVPLGVKATLTSGQILDLCLSRCIRQGSIPNCLEKFSGLKTKFYLSLMIHVPHTLAGTLLHGFLTAKTQLTEQPLSGTLPVTMVEEESTWQLALTSSTQKRPASFLLTFHYFYPHVKFKKEKLYFGENKDQINSHVHVRTRKI